MLIEKMVHGGNAIEIRQDNTMRVTGFKPLRLLLVMMYLLQVQRWWNQMVSDQEFIPCDANGGLRNNAIDLGHPSALFDDIRATNSSIITSSDKNFKTRYRRA